MEPSTPELCRPLQYTFTDEIQKRRVRRRVAVCFRVFSTRMLRPSISEFTRSRSSRPRSLVAPAPQRNGASWRRKSCLDDSLARVRQAFPEGGNHTAPWSTATQPSNSSLPALPLWEMTPYRDRNAPQREPAHCREILGHNGKSCESFAIRQGVLIPRWVLLALFGLGAGAPLLVPRGVD